MTAHRTHNTGFVLVIMYVLLFMIAFVSGFQNPFGVIVKDQFGASNFLSQMSNLANFIAYAIMGYPAGRILYRHGYRISSLIAVGVGIAGVGIQLTAGWTASFALLLTGAFITGFSMCLLNTLTNSLLNHIGGGGKEGNRLLQYGGSFYTLGGMAVPYLVGMLISGNHVLSAATPAFLAAILVFACAAVAIFFTDFPEPDLEARRSGRPVQETADRYGCLSFRHFRLGALAIFLYMGIEVGIANTTNIYLTKEFEMGAASAGAIISLFWLFMIAGRLLGGVAGSRMSPKTMLLSVSALSALLVTGAIVVPPDIVLHMGWIGLDTLPLNVLLLVVCGMFVAVMWGNIFNLAVEGLGRHSASASGVFMTMVCGGGILPALQGIVSDHWGCMASFWLIVASLVYLMYYAVRGSRPVEN